MHCIPSVRPSVRLSVPCLHPYVKNEKLRKSRDWRDLPALQLTRRQVLRTKVPSQCENLQKRNATFYLNHSQVLSL